MARASLVLAAFLVAGGCERGGPACPSIDTFCAQAGRCVRDWATAQQASTWCAADGGTAGSDQVYIRTGCDGFNVVARLGLDTGSYSYYDERSGQLVGVVGYAPPSGSTCLAGIVPSRPADSQCGDGGATPVCGPGP